MSTMKFCREWYAPFYIDHLPLSCIRFIIQLLDDGWTCSNILYPKEDRDRRTLFFACRNCEHQVQLINLYPCSTNKSNPIFLLYPSSVHHYKNGVWAQHLDDGVRMSTKMLMGWGCSLFFPNSKILVGSWQCYVCPSFPPLATYSLIYVMYA